MLLLYAYTVCREAAPAANKKYRLEIDRCTVVYDAHTYSKIRWKKIIVNRYDKI